MKFTIIGIGRLGGALAVALARKGYQIENLVSRNKFNAKKIAGIISQSPQILNPQEFEKINSEIIIISTQDYEIENVAVNLAQKLKNQPIVFHTSGSLSSEILKKLAEKGCYIGSIHPLVSISDAVLGANRFSGGYFCLEGDEEAIKIGNKIVADLDGKPFSIKTENKTLYHASAVTACGHLVALIDVAVEMLTKCGLDEKQSKEVLLPLIESTVENLKNQELSQALTGTFARADVKIFEKHLESLKQNVSDEALEVYLQLGGRSVHLAEEQGTDKVKIKDLRNKISLAKKNLK